MVIKKNIAIIPARGGSKRIPQKNIVEFGGMPMIIWTIKAAQKTGLFDRIVVSTDSEEIASIVEEYGVEVPYLRNACSDDYATVSDATISALKQTIDFWGEKYENVIQLMANCPLRNAEDIQAAYDNFTEKNNRFQISCFKYGWMNPWWAQKLDSNMNPSPVFKNALEKRSQDLESLYCPTGAIWIAKYDDLLQEGSFYGKGYKMFPISIKAAIDIDDYDDLNMAKAFLEIGKA